MPRPAVYSSSRSTQSKARYGAVPGARGASLPPPGAQSTPAAPTTAPHWPLSPETDSSVPGSGPTGATGATRQLQALWIAVLVLAVLLGASVFTLHRAQPPRITQEDIDGAVLRTLETTTLPSAAAHAAAIIEPSIVRVVGYGRSKKGKADVERGVGTGVVIVDKGIILTNLHVVLGAERITLTYHDGLETTASITGAQPENDLAVLQAHRVPDDLQAATLRSTDDLRPGDQVAAVGFPFGIGPSVSAGVVSGLRREFTSPEGQRPLSNLIQFDAAANPGNSGGPLINMDGEVLGIVTAILNPTAARTFLGIGFAVPIENAASAVGMPPF